MMNYRSLIPKRKVKFSNTINLKKSGLRLSKSNPKSPEEAVIHLIKNYNNSPNQFKKVRLPQRKATSYRLPTKGGK